MNSTRSFLNRALAPLSAATIATFALALACSSDPAPAGGGEGGASAGKGGASSAGAAGKAAKAGNAGIEDAGGSAGEADGSAGEAGEAGGAGHGGGAPSAGGMNPGTSGSGGSGTAGGAQGGNGGAPAAVCGNNQLEAGEECDDGNTKDWDGCSHKCKSKCEACETKYCAAPPASQSDVFLNCFTDTGSVSKPTSGKNLALQGPAAGQPKQKLCANLVECLRRTNCSQESISASVTAGCFCGAGTIADCKDPQKGPHGPCMDEVAAAAESTDVALVASRQDLTQYAVGMAVQIALMCDNDACPAECLQDKTPSPCERCTFGDAPFSQSYGFGGSYYACYFQPPLKCGSTTEPTTTCPATTCAPAADCALATRCAENKVEDCYGSDGHGPCAAEFAATTGSTDPATVLDRLTHGGDYASTLLVDLLNSERESSCKSTCFPSAAGGAGGGGAAGAQGGSGGANAGSGG
jgi:cysteine-rich repeat protein